MTYHQAFDQFGNRRVFSKRRADRVVGFFLAVAAIALWAALTDGWMT